MSQNNIDIETLRKQVTFYEVFNKHVEENMDTFNQTVPNFIESLMAKYAPLKLKLIVDGDTIIDLNSQGVNLIFVTTKDSIPILTNNYEIKKPSDIELSEFDHLNVYYNGYCYTFFKEEDYSSKAIITQPMIDSLNSWRKLNIDESCFDERLFWMLNVDRKEKTISLRTRGTTTKSLK